MVVSLSIASDTTEQQSEELTTNKVYLYHFRNNTILSDHRNISDNNIQSLPMGLTALTNLNTL